MEDMDTYTYDSEEDEQENDSDNVDPVWEPEKLRKEYEKTADDDDTCNLPHNQYVFIIQVVNIGKMVL